MTKREELLEQLRLPKADQEAAHCTAEDLLVSYLRAMGDEELADAWNEASYTQGWWYA